MRRDQRCVAQALFSASMVPYFFFSQSDEALAVGLRIRHEAVADLVVESDREQRRMLGVAPGQRVGEARDQALVVRVADVVHVAFGRMEAGALLGDDVGARVLVVQPRRRRLTGDVEDDLDAGGVHLVHDPVEGLELEPAFGGFEVVPRQVAHAHDLEAGLLHQRDVALDLLRAAVDRLVAGADEELAGAGPVGAALGALGVRRAMAEHGDGQRAREGQLPEVRDHHGCFPLGVPAAASGLRRHAK